MTPSLSAIVVAYGSDALLRDSLEALRIALDAVDAPTELIVVLNRVSVPVHTELEQAGDAILIAPGRNLGFAAAVNSGIAIASGKWIALVNDDCVVDAHALAELLTAGETALDIGSVAAQVRFTARPETINSLGIEVDVLGVASERLTGAPISASETGVTDVFGPSGALALYRRAMLEKLGGFDEAFFAYLEDVDIAWRARMDGWRCVYAPAAIAWHAHSSSLGHGSSTKYFLVGRNRMRLLAKNATRAQLARYGLAILAYEIAYVAFAVGVTRTTAPLRGRYRGIREWRSARREGREQRRPTKLSMPAGLVGAYRRWASYESSDARDKDRVNP